MIRGAMKKELHREEGSLPFGAFLKDRLLLFLLHITCMLVLTGYLLLTGYPMGFQRPHSDLLASDPDRLDTV